MVCVPLIPPSLTSCLQVEILFMGPIYGSVFFQPFLATPTLCFLLPLVAEFLSLYIFSGSYNTPGRLAGNPSSVLQAAGNPSSVFQKVEPQLKIAVSLLLAVSGLFPAWSPCVFELAAGCSPQEGTQSWLQKWGGAMTLALRVLGMPAG